MKILVRAQGDISNLRIFADFICASFSNLVKHVVVHVVLNNHQATWLQQQGHHRSFSFITSFSLEMTNN